MSKIRIKNFGPIKGGYQENDGWLDIKKVTVFIGEQGSGKSTIAKLISTFTWIEKALNRGDIQMDRGIDIINSIDWQRLKNYLNDNSEINYIGDRYRIDYVPSSESWPIIKRLESNNYVVPKIMYVPAERNFLSTIKSAFDVSGLPGPLAEFSEELKRAQFELKDLKLKLPIKNFFYEYDSRDDISYVTGKNYKINLLEASSGLQSLIPLFLVSRNLASKVKKENDPSTATVSANQSVRRDKEISSIMMNKTLTSEDKSRMVNEIFAKYHNQCFINIVEEPEQNLFPTSQRQILNNLLEYTNLNINNSIILTTHSPYIINYLTLAVKANFVHEKIRNSDKKNELLNKLKQIVPLDSLVNAASLRIYELNETEGTIIKLPDYKGLPSDENYLNAQLAENNELFANLLEIEDLCH